MSTCMTTGRHKILNIDRSLNLSPSCPGTAPRRALVTCGLAFSASGNIAVRRSPVKAAPHCHPAARHGEPCLVENVRATSDDRNDRDDRVMRLIDTTSGRGCITDRGATRRVSALLSLGLMARARAMPSSAALRSISISQTVGVEILRRLKRAII